MIWAAFSATGKLEILFTTHRMNSGDYQKVLRQGLLPFLRLHRGQGFIFQQDNAPIHDSRSTMRWLRAQRVAVLDWPPCSPDLNPIENLWGILARRVYAENRQFQNVAELRTAIERAWQEIDQNTINNLVKSMQNRIFQVINRNGGPTDY